MAEKRSSSQLLAEVERQRAESERMMTEIERLEAEAAQLKAVEEKAATVSPGPSTSKKTR
jgi:hypothetical protein